MLEGEKMSAKWRLQAFNAINHGPDAGIQGIRIKTTVEKRKYAKEF
jgi:hypothetical protein